LGSGKGEVEESFENGSEPSGFIKRGDLFTNYAAPWQDSAPKNK
jgi:hypothetical protein